MHATSRVGEFGAQVGRTLARGKSVIASNHGGAIVGRRMLSEEVGRFVSQSQWVDLVGIGCGRECGVCVGALWTGVGKVAQ